MKLLESEDVFFLFMFYVLIHYIISWLLPNDKSSDQIKFHKNMKSIKKNNTFLGVQKKQTQKVCISHILRAHKVGLRRVEKACSLP